MAFQRNAGFTSAIATNPADTAAGYLTPTRYNLPLVVSGATVGGVPFCPTAASETTSSGLTYNAGGAAGEGLVVSPGTAASAVSLLSMSQGRNFNTSASKYIDIVFTMTSVHANDLPVSIRGGAAGTTNLFKLDQYGSGSINGFLEFANGQGTAPTVGILNAGSNRLALYASGVASFYLQQGVGPILLSTDGLAWCATTDPATRDTSISRVSAGTVQVGTGTFGAAGSLNLTNLTTTAASGTGTAAIIDGSNVLRPLTSSARFKTNIKAWSPSADQLTAFYSLPDSIFDYLDTPARTMQQDVVDATGSKTGTQTVEIEAARAGAKGIVGFTAEDIHNLGLTEMINYDAQGLPYSLKEHGVLAYLHAAVKNINERLVKAGL